MISNVRNLWDKTFAAVSFAEAGEVHTARELAGYQPLRRHWLQRWSRLFSHAFAAAAFAEADCPEMARSLLSGTAAPKKFRSLDLFLEDVGLKGVQVRYGLALV